jgi:hypothetical protein
MRLKEKEYKVVHDPWRAHIPRARPVPNNIHRNYYRGNCLQKVLFAAEVGQMAGAIQCDVHKGFHVLGAAWKQPLNSEMWNDSCSKL